MRGLKAPETKEQTVIHVGWDLSVCVKGRPRLDSREAGQCPGNLTRAMCPKRWELCYVGVGHGRSEHVV